MKKTLLLLFTLAFVFALSVISKAETYGDLTYEISDEEITITDCNSSATTIEIPNEINGYPVNNFGDNAFSYCENLISVIISDGVINIGDGAFKYCKSLTSVIMPDTLISIGYDAFMGCNNLIKIIIPDSVLVIGDKAFGYYDYLNESIDAFIIYGYEGTVAEIYANENYIPFLALKKSKSTEIKETDIDIKVERSETTEDDTQLKTENTEIQLIFLILIIFLFVIIISLIVVLIIMAKKKSNS